ncbi:hypothetical protein F8388_027233 [Cannabis sativa]|uniref:U3 small nucleolar RNA-associated protein 6 homolog n=1 Tax=Cannabis sativa TaxID=3483 RepID=A0A7J6FRW3_CANSA|nr:hypothetical protein F8388_027233 [Cannabis sativa]
MADVVQYRLERMVNELDDLERRGIFTRREINEIVKQRRKFEYRLKRPSPLKQDYLAYIEYETQLDSLRRLRKKSVARQLRNQGTDENKKKMKKSVSDFAGVVRIVDIYRLAVTRYKGDIDLWFRYLEFCREKRHGRMKKVLAQAIRFHPKVPGLWIYAAAWEFDHNLNVAAARALMQSGLRVCPTSEELWIEYLRMELTYLNKLKARKVALGEDEGTLVRDKKVAGEKQWRDDNEDLFMSLNEEKENNESNVENKETRGKVDVFREQGFSILKAIYSGAIEALPSSLNLRKKFFEILDALDLAHSEEMHEQILSEMKRDFSTEPEYWDWLARLEFDPEAIEGMSDELVLSQTEKAIQVYEEALKVMPSAKVFDNYTRFMMDVILLQKGEKEILELSGPYATYISHLLGIYEKAKALGCITEDLAYQYVSFYLQLGRLDEARNLADKLCRETFLDSTRLWLLKASLEVRHVTRDSLSSPTKADLLSIFGLLKDVLPKISVSKAESLWIMALKLFSSQKEYFEKLVGLSIVSISKDGDSDNGFSLSSAIVNFVLQNDGIQSAREMYKRFLALPHPGLAIYRNCIDLETNLASVGDKDGLVNARKLFESALSTYGQNLSLWQNYHRLETKMGTSETASAVHWRARKILKDSTALFTSDF